MDLGEDMDILTKEDMVTPLMEHPMVIPERFLIPEQLLMLFQRPGHRLLQEQ